MKILSIAVVLAAVAACWTDKTSPTMPPPVTNPAPVVTPPPPAVDPLAALPVECREYGATIHRLATCDQMPKAARDAMREAFDDAAATWANLPPDVKAQLADGCKAGLDAVNEAAKSVCGPSW